MSCTVYAYYNTMWGEEDVSRDSAVLDLCCCGFLSICFSVLWQFHLNFFLRDPSHCVPTGIWGRDWFHSLAPALSKEHICQWNHIFHMTGLGREHDPSQSQKIGPGTFAGTVGTDTTPASVAQGWEGYLVLCIFLATIWGEAACKWRQTKGNYYWE